MHSPRNHFAPWSRSDDHKLLRYIRLNKPNSWIMEQLGRSQESLRQRLIRLYNVEAAARDMCGPRYSMDALMVEVIDKIRREPWGFTNRAVRAMWMDGQPSGARGLDRADAIRVVGPEAKLEIIDFKTKETKPMLISHKFSLVVDFVAGQARVHTEQPVPESEAIEIAKQLAFDNPGTDFFVLEAKQKFTAGSVRATTLKVAPKVKKVATKKE